MAKSGKAAGTEIMSQSRYFFLATKTLGDVKRKFTRQCCYATKTSLATSAPTAPLPTLALSCGSSLTFTKMVRCSIT